VAIGELLKPVRKKRIVAIVATVAAVLLFIFASVHNYVRARDQQLGSMQGYAERTLVAVDEDVTRLIDDSDSYLRALRAFYLDHGIDDEAARYAFRQYNERIRPSDPNMYLGDFGIFDAQGHPKFVLSQPEPVAADISDRAYFKELKSEARDRLVIDPTSIGRTVAEYRFRLVRPILRDGMFSGVMIVTLRPEAIIDLFEKFNLGPNSTIAVLDTDNHRFIARVPVGDRAYFDRPLGDELVWRLLDASPHGVFHRESPVDHTTRYFTFLKSADVPIVSAVGVAEIDIDNALAKTRREIEIEALVFALTAVAICGLVLRIVSVEDRLRRSQANLEHGQRIGRIGSVEVDLLTQEAHWSDQLYAIYGRDPALGPADLEAFLGYVHPDDKDKANQMREWQKRGIDGGPIEYRIRLPSGEVRWIHREVEIRRDPSGKPTLMLATEQDITERWNMEDKLQREHARLVFAQRMARMGSAEVNLRTGAVVRSDELFHLVGGNPGSPPTDHNDMAAAFHPEDQEKATNAVKNMLAGLPVPAMELRILGADGETRWVRRDQEFVNGEDGQPERAVVTLLDITDQKLLQLQKDEFAATLMSLANQDALTGLPALRLARDRLQMACNQADRDNSQIAVLFIDLDGFKAANDQFGHAAGDQVLKTVAARLVDTIRSGDTAARHGGDEFLVILNSVGPEGAAQVAGKLVEAIARPIPYEGAAIKVGASIGIAIFPDHAGTPEELLHLADHAMYVVKKSGKNGFKMYVET
jgi:diguanylate cyclase (GGDEF)-like protein